MLKKLSLCAGALLTCTSIQAADWDGISIPAPAGSGNTWQLQTVSDDFNYSATPTNKPAQFNNRWNASYINPWTGPGDTEFNSGHSYTTGGSLALQSSAKAGTDKIYTGIISSKATFTYPLYLEARAKPSNNTLANAVWLLSPDSTQEIDAMESYGSDRPTQAWFDQRMHVSHHVFIRNPFQDYQPKDGGAWVYNGGESYRTDMKRYGVHWKDPWNLDYYIDGVLVRSVSGPDIIDPENFTNGTGLNKAMQIIIDVEHQPWRDVKPTAAELADTNKSIFFVDWIRVYKPVNNGGGGGNNGGGNSTTPPTGVTSLKARNSNRCIDLSGGSNANGTNIQQWGCNGNNANQDFTFVSKGNGYYLMQTKHNKCVDISGKSTTNGASAVQWDCYDGDNQQFQTVDKGNGWFQLKAKHSNKCLEVANSSNANGGNIRQWACGNGNNQQFTFQ